MTEANAANAGGQSIIFPEEGATERLPGGARDAVGLGLDGLVVMIGARGAQAGRTDAVGADVDAVLFDMDGVVTDTATRHERAWKRLFDRYLADHTPPSEPFVPFSGEDYRRYVDGRRRLDGVTGFLGSRHIELPLGSPSGPATSDTAWGLANAKNALFHEVLDEMGVPVFDTTVAFVGQLAAGGVPCALVTASSNAAAVLKAAGIADLFDVRVDGRDLEEIGLPGKPDPACFLEAARRLGVPPGRAAVVEDSPSGVEAGRRGGFGLVIGVERNAGPVRLRDHGADLVVTDLGDLVLDGA